MNLKKGQEKIQTEAQREERKTAERSMRDMWDTIKRLNLCIIREKEKKP